MLHNEAFRQRCSVCLDQIDLQRKKYSIFKKMIIAFDPSIYIKQIKILTTSQVHVLI